MKQLLKLSLAFVLMAFFASGALGQSADRKSMSKDEKVNMKVERMKTELSLSDEQATKLRTVYMKHFNSDNKPATKEEWKSKREAMHSEMKAILTADQMKKFEAMQAERKAKMKEKHGNKGKHKGEERRKNIQEKKQDAPVK